jgi:hypothetical protein
LYKWRWGKLTSKSNPKELRISNSQFNNKLSISSSFKFPCVRGIKILINFSTFMNWLEVLDERKTQLVQISNLFISSGKIISEELSINSLTKKYL